MKFTITTPRIMLLASSGLILRRVTRAGAAATQISLGQYHSCAIDNHDRLWCWSSANFDGQVGNSTSEYKNYPPTIVSLGNDETFATQISLGRFHSCAIDNHNNLKCWGANLFGELGDGTTIGKDIPTIISLGNDVFATQISLGGSHSCAIDNKYNLLCWGLNDVGQLGDGTTIDKDTPTTISLGHDVVATQISLGQWHSCAIDDKYNLLCWGNNSYGQLGDGTTIGKDTPTTISLGYDVVATQISLGHYHSCAIDNLNSLWCWGDNEFGQLGTGTIIDRNIPTTIDLDFRNDGTFATRISLGQYHSCAIDNLNSLWCWGGSPFGGSANGRKVIPTIVSLGYGGYATQIALGGFRSCAVNNKGNIKCWDVSSGRKIMNPPTNVDLKRSIPTYAKIFIGILVPVAIILAAIGIYIYIGQRKKKQQGQQQLPIQEELEDGKPAFPISNKTELNSSPTFPNGAKDSQLPEKVDVAQQQGVIVEP